VTFTYFFLFIMPVTHIIKYHEANQRLDHLLLKQSFVTNHQLTSRSECVNAIKNGVVLVNNAKTKSSYVLKTGDIITFAEYLHSKVSSLTPNHDFALRVLFENEHFITLDKPAGIAMHPTALNGTDTVANWLVAHFPDITAVGEDPLRPGIVHRLDKDTSGVCVVAKTKEAFIALKELFKTHVVQKTYVAVVHGHITPTEGTINTPIAKSLTLNKQAVIDTDLMVRGRIRDAITHYQVLHSYADYDFVEAQPKTGRKHQIRVHLFSIGHPIVGDKLYSTKLTRKADRECANSPKRQLLHAKRLQFSLFNKAYDFSSPLPEDFTRFLDDANTK
jgi:23S rRNA pseudouridine1911/1915/1917 synthase